MNFLNFIIGRPQKPVILNTLHGFKINVDPVTDNGVERSIYWTGTYEIGTLNIFQQILKKEDVFYDIGANIGLMSLFMANRNRSVQVFSFEPEPTTFKLLQKNILLNAFDNIRPFDFAIGANEAEEKIYANIGVNRGAASLVIKDSEEEGVSVMVHTLEYVIHTYQLPLPTIMKIDVEGYELEVLKGSVKILSGANAPVLCLEYSKDTTQHHDVSDIYDFVKNVNSYRVFKFEKWKGNIGRLIEVNHLDEMPADDNVFCFLDKHLEKLNRSIFKSPIN